MDRHTPIAVLFCVAAVLGTLSPTRADDRAWTVEEQAIIDAMKTGPVGISANFDRWAAGYSDAWTYWRVGDRATRPKNEHMPLVREFVDAGNRVVSFELEPIDVIVREETALLRLIATETLQNPEGELRMVRYASAAMLAREDGVWKLLATNIVYLDED